MEASGPAADLLVRRTGLVLLTLFGMLPVYRRVAKESRHGTARWPYWSGCCPSVALLAVLVAVFLAGFREAVRIAIPLVVSYLLLNAVVVVVGFVQIAGDPGRLRGWRGGADLGPRRAGRDAGDGRAGLPLLVLEATVLLCLGNISGLRPHCYLAWAEGHPIANRCGTCSSARATRPVTREVLREAEEDPRRRPAIHVGG